LGEIDSASDHTELLAKWRAAHAAYKEGRFEAALAGFRAAASLRSDDGPSCVFIERCAAFLKEGTPQGWDGTWHFDRK
jgi:adenylate cyclase